MQSDYADTAPVEALMDLVGFRYWPKCEVPTGSGNVCYLGWNRRTLRTTQLTRSGRITETQSIVTDEQRGVLHRKCAKSWERFTAFAGGELPRIDPRPVATDLDKAATDGRCLEFRGIARSANCRRLL